MRCEQCAYWEPHSENPGSMGNCRRYPPQLIITSIDIHVDFDNYYPQTHSDDYCGEFRES